MIYKDATGYSGCGLRFLVAYNVAGRIETADFDVNIRFFDETLIGYAKARIETTESGESERDAFVESFEISSEDGKLQPKMKARFFDSEDKRYRYVTLLPEDAFETVVRAITGEKMHFQFSRTGVSGYRVIAFRRSLDRESAATLTTCFRSTLKRAEMLPGSK